ncbi:exportin-4 isoform X1 [Helianthus annuus]|uniref:exportin-4 isoform X1 n=1 Tax=Helianthus annuus TaxID=4232 RepID=UPI001652CD4F|nr:exportin-4 isoform X1 [Helianthus annuus]
MLQLLQKLCTKDMVDVSSAASDDQQTSISQVIYVGVHIVSTLITIEMLKYPKLCYDHFALLSHMLEVYPEMIPKLNHEAFSHISGTLDYGLHHQDEEIVGTCLRSLRALAFYHYNEREGGRDGLGPHGTDADGNFQDGILSKFLRSLMQLLLFEDYSMDLVGGAADALFPLIPGISTFF